MTKSMLVPTIDLAPEDWPANAGRAPFAVRHHLVDDPRLTHEAIVALSGRISVDDVEMTTKDLPVVMDSDHVPELDRAPSELARDIELLDRWMALSYIEQDPAYRELVDAVLDDVEAASADWAETMSKREGYLFLSAPGAVTPAHVDHEHNFLLQIQGRKRITLGFAAPDVEARALEGMYSGRYGRSSALPEVTEQFVLEPGTGVYVPPRAVHTLENQDEISISLSLVFHTPALDQAANVYAFNAKMRRVGLRPRPPERSARTDAAKSAAVRSWRRVRNVDRG